MLTEAGFSVQYFQHGALQYQPQNSPPYDYQLTNIGLATANQRSGNESALDSALKPISLDAQRGRYFSETGHHVGNDNGFLQLFDTISSLDLGNPVSEQYSTRDGRVEQYFQKAKFEGRPGSSPPAALGNVGLEYLLQVRNAIVCHRLLGNENQCVSNGAL